MGPLLQAHSFVLTMKKHSPAGSTAMSATASAHRPVAMVAARDRVRLRVLRGLRRLGVAAQPLRPGHPRARATRACRPHGAPKVRPSTCSAPTTRAATFSRPSIYGARISLIVGLVSVVLSVVVGVVLGLLAGFFGGWLDAFLMRVCDVMLSFPPILVALLMAGVGRALFPGAHELARLRRADHFHLADRLGAVRAHGARFHAGGAQQGIRAGRRASPAWRRCASCCATCCPT